MVRAMRFLHTSDWHLGRSLHRTDLRDAQSRFLDHLVETAREERVDAVLIAGDIYDRAVPPVDAVALCEDALRRLRDTGARVIVISGNHDSARRLGFSSALIDASGVHLRTRPSAVADPVVLDDADGQVAVYGVPYLEPAIGVSALGAEKPGAESDPSVRRPRSHEAVMRAAADRIRADAARRRAARTVVLAHVWAHGGDPSASERDISVGDRSSSGDSSVGGLGHVPLPVFDAFSYVALGHLHGQQVLADNIRYSGSPLPYSFSEKSHKKGTWLVDIDGDGKVRADRVPAPVFRRLSEVHGQLDDLVRSREYADYEGDFLAVTLTDTQRPDRAMDRLRVRFPHILTLEFKPEGVLPDGRRYGEKVAGKDDLAIAAEFVQHVRNGPPTPGERQLLASAFEAARAEAL
jgi:DNA repair protein SbcD/Mre11